VRKIKDKFLHDDYQHNLCKHVQNLKQKETFVPEYTRSFSNYPLG
jgi:hypothetical protein